MKKGAWAERLKKSWRWSYQKLLLPLGGWFRRWFRPAPENREAMPETPPDSGGELPPPSQAAPEPDASEPEPLAAETAAPPSPPGWKDQALADFGDWLDQLPESPPACEPVGPQAGDLYSLMREFTALKGEIKLQNREQHKSAQALEQALEAARELGRVHEGAAARFESASQAFASQRQDLVQLWKQTGREAEKQAVLPFLEVRDALVRGVAAARALKTEHKGWFGPPKGVDGVIEGYEMALRRFDRALSQLGIAPVDPLNQPFDPRIMRAVERRSRSDQPDNQVVAVQLAGFVRGQEVLRTAEVIVNRNQTGLPPETS